MAPASVVDDYYEILEVEETADKMTIKASYKRLARLRHPDKDRHNPNAKVAFQLVSIVILLSFSFSFTFMSQFSGG